MTFRWVVGGAVALALLRPGAATPLEAAGGTFVCPATAKPANLNFTLKNLDNVDVKMSYPVLQGLGHDDVLEAFGPMIGLPTTLVMSPDGKICATHTGLSSRESFETQIKALLPERR